QAPDLLHETARADDLAQPPQDMGARLRPKLRWEMGEDIAEGAGIGKAQRSLGGGEALFGLDHLHGSRLETRGLEQCTHIDRVDAEDDALTRPGVGVERRLAQRRHHHLLERRAITLQARADTEPTAAAQHARELA